MAQEIAVKAIEEGIEPNDILAGMTETIRKIGDDFGKGELFLSDLVGTGSDEKAIEEILNEAREFYRKNGNISDKEWEAYKEDLNSPGYPYY
jgi:methanogenic corrinoid protein MtbC1